MGMRKFKVLIEWDPNDSVWVTQVPALNHLSTYGSTKEEALAESREAILGYFEAAAIEQIQIEDVDREIDLVELEIATA